MSIGMEKKLIEAAKEGDVDKLHTLIKEYPLMLKAVALGCGDTPLHMACMGGHLGFVKEVLKLGGPEFVEELNVDGFTPLHVASGGGDPEIVKEVLKVGRHVNVCLLKGSENRIPLHCAVSKGRIEVIKELLLACQDSITEVTVKGETCLHLALKNNKFEAFKLLCEYGDIGDVFNGKDQQGNTIWHLLASSRIQYEVVGLLLDQSFPLKDKLELNLLNKKGLTPLDVLISQGVDCEIEEMLTLAGATRSSEAELSQNLEISSENPPNNTSSEQGRRSDRPRSATQKLQDYFKYDKFKESPSSARNTLLVIAILITTATYQAVLSPPGGVWQDDYWPDAAAAAKNSTAKQPPRHTAGQSIMGTHYTVSYSMFLFFNSMGFFMSINMILFLMEGFPLQFELGVALVALTTTYDVCMGIISPAGWISMSFVGVGSVPTLIMHTEGHGLRFPDCRRRNERCKREGSKIH